MWISSDKNENLPEFCSIGIHVFVIVDNPADYQSQQPFSIDNINKSENKN